MSNKGLSNFAKHPVIIIFTSLFFLIKLRIVFKHSKSALLVTEHEFIITNSGFLEMFIFSNPCDNNLLLISEDSAKLTLQPNVIMSKVDI